MISKIARLRAKKGFTLVELIVVIAIIGILIAIAAAAMSYDRKPAIGKGMAKDFFYKTQDCLATVRVGFPKAFDAKNSEGNAMQPVNGFFIEIDNTGDIEKWGTFENDPTSNTMPTYHEITWTTQDIKRTGKAEDDRTALLVRMRQCFDAYLTDMDNMSGTLYVLVDGFKAECAYWTDCSHEFPGPGLLVDDNVADSGYYLCAYPIYRSFGGKRAFVS